MFREISQQLYKTCNWNCNLHKFWEHTEWSVNVHSLERFSDCKYFANTKQRSWSCQLSTAAEVTADMKPDQNSVSRLSEQLIVAVL